MDSSKIKNIRQDLQDYLDRRTFGLRACRRRRKNPINPVNPVSKKQLNIESIQNSVHFREKKYCGEFVTVIMDRSTNSRDLGCGLRGLRLARKGYSP